jgi:sugar transport system substrate-binding protein
MIRQIVAAALVLTLMMPGCSPAKKETGKRTIAGMVFQEDQFFRLVLFGMRDAAKKHGVNFLEANSVGRPDKEIELIGTYISNHVDAIILSPLSAQASVSALSRAHEKGITIVTYNTTVESDIPASFIESDQVKLGASTGAAAREYIARHLGGKANVAILAFVSNAPEQSNMRTDGFKSEITKLPGVHIVAEQDAWMPETAVKKAGDILTANPDIDIIFAANEGGTIGSVLAVKNAGKGDRVKVFGTDMGDQLISFLLSDDNILQAITAQQPFMMGSMAVDAAIDVLDGKPVEKKVELSGVLLTREHPDDIRAFKQRLDALIAEK